MRKSLTYSFRIVAAALFIAVCNLLIAARSAPPRTPAKKAFGGSNDLNVVYGHNINNMGKDEQLNMDIFMPANMDKNKKYPLVILVHGGTFIGGNKNGLDKECQMLADSGFVGVTINYRLGWKIPLGKDCSADLTDQPNAVYRAYQDTHAALRYLMHNADKYHIDKNWVFAGGNSAGAVVAWGISYIDQPFADKIMPAASKAMGPLNAGSNDLKETFKIRGIAGLWGCLPDSNLITAKTAIPAIMFHGTKDLVVAYDHGRWRGVDCPNFPMEYGSACLYRQLKRFNQPAVLTSIIGAGHGPPQFKGHPEITMSNSACFFHAVMAGKAHTASYTVAQTGCL